MPWVTRFSRISGVQPIVSRTFPYGLVWGGIRVRLGPRAVRNRARRVGGREGRGRVAPHGRGVASRHARGGGRGGGGRDRRGERPPAARPRARGSHPRAGEAVGTGAGTGWGRGFTVSGSPLRTDPPACGWWNSIGCRNAVAIGRP